MMRRKKIMITMKLTMFMIVIIVAIIIIIITSSSSSSSSPSLFSLSLSSQALPSSSFSLLSFFCYHYHTIVIIIFVSSSVMLAGRGSERQSRRCQGGRTGKIEQPRGREAVGRKDEAGREIGSARAGMGGVEATLAQVTRS